MIKIPPGAGDAELLPSRHEYIKSFWSDTSQEPRAQYNKLMGNTPIADGVVFRPAAVSEPPGVRCEPSSADK